MKRAAQVRITPTDAGENGTGYVVSNLASATSFLADQQTVEFIEAIDRTGDPARAVQQLGLDQTQAEHLLNQLVASGVLVETGSTAEPPKAKKPFETKLIFFRLDLLDIGPLVRSLSPLLRLPFTASGFLVWAGLIVAAISTLTREPDAIATAARSLTQLSWEGAVALAIVFTILKIVHELGHATALWLNCQTEGVNVRTIRAGISFFAFFPFPFTDATVAWQLRSRYRRAGIALAGIYLESWIAAIAAIVWGQIKPGETQMILFQVLIVSGVSTLLFNLNPLVRLDGYYVFSDLARRPNLATRAAGAARAMGGWLLGGVARPVSGFHLGYWLLSYAYRWVIFAGIFWIAYTIEPGLAVPVAVIAVISLILRPMFVTAKQAWSGDFAWGRLTATIVCVAALTAGVTVRVPDRIIVAGTLVRYEAEPIRARHDVRVAMLAESVSDVGDRVVVRMESRALELDLARLLTHREQIEGALRAGRAKSASEVDLLSNDLERVQSEITRTKTAMDALTVMLPDTAQWEPSLPLAQDTWLSAHQNRVVGRVLRPVTPYVVAKIDQNNADLIEILGPRTDVPARVRTDLDCIAALRVERFGKAGGPGNTDLEIKVAVPADDSCLTTVPSGSEVMLYLARADSSVANQIYRTARRLAQNRLPIGDTRGE